MYYYFPHPLELLICAHRQHWQLVLLNFSKLRLMGVGGVLLPDDTVGIVYLERSACIGSFDCEAKLDICRSNFSSLFGTGH